MVHQNVEEVRQLVDRLRVASGNKGNKKKSFTCRKSTFRVERSDGISVDSWKFMDWDYKRDDLPTYARGLFTTMRKDQTPEIAVRGYDKFFNVGEVPETKWDYIEAHTRGPYELSVKENGCIIFISGLEDGTLLVCSKHSTGFRQDAVLSHALAGERWVEQHLMSVGKTTKDLAAELRRMNATAVGELCDDRFEEHVLAYDKDASGIYLHGINYNVPEFATLPSSEVHKFADTWGFKKAEFLVMDDLDTVKKFLDQCAETGSWNGRDTEGFVIRCKMNTDPGTYQDWFFKYKFEEPYLMYRQWREATKSMIAGRKPNIKKHKKITEEYLQYARRQLIQNPQIAKLYNQNHGIIAIRDGFLRERGLKGSEIIAMEIEGALEPDKPVTRDVIIVPVASLGCGKTTVALALTKLYNWGHVQNDDIPRQKNRPQKFALELTRALLEHPVVIADRNNHQRRERKQIMDDVLGVVPDARFVAFQYVHEPKQQLLDEIREVTRKRVLDRGDNHQTIKAGTTNPGEIIGIMEGFLDRFEAVNIDQEPDDRFDEVIDLNVADSSRENLEKIVLTLHSRYPEIIKHMPKQEELDKALDVARHDYQVEKDLSQSSNKQNRKQDKKNDPEPRMDPNVLAKRIQYFKISLTTSRVLDILSSLFPPSTLPLKAKLYNQLLKTRRIKDFHVTLIHKSSKELPDMWDYYKDLYLTKMHEQRGSDNPVLGSVRVRVERLVWNDAIMAFVVRIMPASTAGKAEADWPCANEIPHITVGTASPDVKPKESNDLLKHWLEVGSGESTGIWESEVPSMTVLEGSVEAFITRRTR
ncbi:tRNA ligase [Elaphomyces granulatus]